MFDHFHGRETFCKQYQGAEKKKILTTDGIVSRRLLQSSGLGIQSILNRD